MRSGASALAIRSRALHRRTARGPARGPRPAPSRGGGARAPRPAAPGHAPARRAAPAAATGGRTRAAEAVEAAKDGRAWRISASANRHATALVDAAGVQLGADPRRGGEHGSAEAPDAGGRCSAASAWNASRPQTEVLGQQDRAAGHFRGSNRPQSSYEKSGSSVSRAGVGVGEQEPAEAAAEPQGRARRDGARRRVSTSGRRPTAPHPPASATCAAARLPVAAAAGRGPVGQPRHATPLGRDRVKLASLAGREVARAGEQDPGPVGRPCRLRVVAPVARQAPLIGACPRGPGTARRGRRTGRSRRSGRCGRGS